LRRQETVGRWFLLVHSLHAFSDLFLNRRRRTTNTLTDPRRWHPTVKQNSTGRMGIQKGSCPATLKIARRGKVGMKRMGWKGMAPPKNHRLVPLGRWPGRNKIVVGDYTTHLCSSGGINRKQGFESYMHIYVTITSFIVGSEASRSQYALEER